ncbi:MAG: carboxypeptidase-like regulatory domain-containing protein, partial [Candidatus Altiarchaeota archaeon]
VQYQMHYELMAELSPAGSSLLHLIVTKTDYAKPNDVKATVEASIEEAKETMASYKAEADSGTDYKGKVCYWPAKEEAILVSGTITDGHGNPMPYLKVEVDYKGKIHEVITDEEGYYEAEVQGLVPNEDDPPEITIRPKFEYMRDDKKYFTVIDKIDSDNIIYLERTLPIKTEDDLEQDIDFKIIEPADVFEQTDGDIKYSSDTQLGNMINFAKTYTYVADAVDFALTVLKADIDYKLPVEVYSGGDGTYYVKEDSQIFLTEADADYKSPEHPKNIEYHEFCHHILFSQWNGTTIRLNVDKNHGGYINSNTADSYTEGFAEFCSMAISENHKSNDPRLKPPEIYCIFGSLEKNYRAWDKRGYNEELALAGYLWDLHDKNNEGDDKVTLSMEEMWPIMKVKRPNVYEYHKAFKQAFPDKADAIDKIAIMHGFFADTRKGNGVYDPVFEPIRNGKFVDYGEGDELAVFIMQYDPGEVIGRASNYNRNRSKAGFLPNAFIKIPDTEVKYYKVNVHFNKPADGPDYEYQTEVRGGLLYLQPLPDGEDATITVTPDTLDYTSTPYTITSKELDQKYYDAPLDQGYVDEHIFDLQPTGTQNDPPQYPLLGVEGEYTWDTEKGYDGGGEDEESSACCCLPLLPGILALSASILMGIPYAINKK